MTHIVREWHKDLLKGGKKEITFISIKKDKLYIAKFLEENGFAGGIWDQRYVGLALGLNPKHKPSTAAAWSAELILHFCFLLQIYILGWWNLEQRLIIFN